MSPGLEEPTIGGEGLGGHEADTSTATRDEADGVLHGEEVRYMELVGRSHGSGKRWTGKTRSGLISFANTVFLTRLEPEKGEHETSIVVK